jgi:hypothetical protein
MPEVPSDRRGGAGCGCGERRGHGSILVLWRMLTICAGTRGKQQSTRTACLRFGNKGPPRGLSSPRRKSCLPVSVFRLGRLRFRVRRFRPFARSAVRGFQRGFRRAATRFARNTHQTPRFSTWVRTFTRRNFNEMEASSLNVLARELARHA